MSDLLEDVRSELVAAIDDALALGPDLFRPPQYGPYVQWRDKTSDFVEAVFGSVERQRFHEAYDHPDPPNLALNLEDHRKRLQDLRDRPQTWRLQVNAEGLRKAAEARRLRTPAEQIVEATERGASSRPDGEASQANPSPPFDRQRAIVQLRQMLGKGEGLPDASEGPHSKGQINRWENRVLAVLEARPDLQDVFLTDPPRYPFLDLLRAFRLIAKSPPPSRLGDRLGQLSAVIEILKSEPAEKTAKWADVQRIAVDRPQTAGHEKQGAWAWIKDNAAALGVVVTVLGIIASVIVAIATAG